MKIHIRLNLNRLLRAVSTACLAAMLLSASGDAVELGLAAQYGQDRGLQADTNVIKFWDYESGETFRDGWGGRLSIYKLDANLANVFLGANSVRADIVGGTTGYGDRMILTKPETCLYQRYYFKLQNGFEFAWPGLKCHGFAGYGAGKEAWYPQGSAGNMPDGTDKFYAISGPRSDFTMGAYHYHMDQILKTPGEAWGDMESFGPVLPTNRWTCVEMMIKLNDPGMANGELKFWLDGNPVWSRTNMRWRSIPDLKINLILDHVFNNIVKNQSLWFDNRVVARKYIGPATGVKATTILIDPKILPPARTGNAYSATHVPFGGKPPYLWAVATGSLPGGIIHNASTGTISGTPTAPGGSSFMIKVTDADQVSSTKSYTIVASGASLIGRETGGIQASVQSDVVQIRAFNAQGQTLSPNTAGQSTGSCLIQIGQKGKRENRRTIRLH